VAKSILQTAVIGCTLCNVVVGMFEPMPISLTFTGIVAHATYFHTLKTFPLLDAGPAFYGSCVLILVHNYLAFSTFAETWFPFDEFLAYFVLCVWLVPFGLFVSLSVNDNVLPTHGGGGAAALSGGLVGNDRGQKPPRSGLLVAMDGVRNFAGEVAGV